MYTALRFIAVEIYISNTPESQSEEEYLAGPEDEYSSVMSDLEKQNISVSYDDTYREIIIDLLKQTIIFHSLKGASFIKGFVVDKENEKFQNILKEIR